MSKSIAHCISCQSEKIRKKRGALPLTVHGKVVKIPNVEWYECAQCGETFLDLDNESKIDAYLERQRTSTVSAGSP
jgi:YgiT-type zinc finger domain-containing protein